MMSIQALQSAKNHLSHPFLSTPKTNYLHQYQDKKKNLLFIKSQRENHKNKILVSLLLKLTLMKKMMKIRQLSRVPSLSIKTFQK